MARLLRKFWTCESGATAIEYVLIGGFVSVMIVTGATMMGTQLVEKFNSISNNMT